MLIVAHQPPKTIPKAEKYPKRAKDERRTSAAIKHRSSITSLQFRANRPKKRYPMLIRKNKKGKLKGNSLLDGVSGKLGDVLVLKQYKDKLVLANYVAKVKAKPSKKQVAHRILFMQAQSYAQKVKKNPKESAKYAKNLKGKRNVYQAALSDYMRKGK